MLFSYLYGTTGWRVLAGVENCIFVVGNYVKMVIISCLKYDPIGGETFSVVCLCKNAHILVTDILCFHFVSRNQSITSCLHS